MADLPGDGLAKPQVGLEPGTFCLLSNALTIWPQQQSSPIFFKFALIASNLVSGLVNVGYYSVPLEEEELGCQYFALNSGFMVGANISSALCSIDITTGTTEVLFSPVGSIMYGY